jgi:acyl-CoA reductase-like NAD-dependent aldehyde dehydrogenase
MSLQPLVRLLMSSLDSVLHDLKAGAVRHADRDAAARAALAIHTAHTVTTHADRWVQAAVGIKTRITDGRQVSAMPAVIAEETATGPLATLRLLAITARVLGEVARNGLPQAGAPPRVLHAAAGPAGPESFIGIDVLPERRLLDGTIFSGHSATVRCVNPGGLAAFTRSWHEEARTRPRQGGVALVLGAGNVTGLAVADAISQIFEYGRAVLLKLHPLHADLESVLRDTLAPLVEAGLLAFMTGGPDVAQAAVAAPGITHVHLTGGQGAFDAIVWGGPGPRPSHAQPVLTKPMTCELGNVTPWIVVPGRYTPKQLAFQADVIAASIANNTSFNCIATKAVVTCRSWDQREEFTALVARRLAALPARPAWYPGAVAAWAEITGRQPPADGSLPAVFRAGLDPRAEPRWLAREWFVPVAVEVPLDADSIESFCVRTMEFTRSIPGSLAASVTLPASLPAAGVRRVDLLCEHLEYGVVGVNTWSALAYAFGSVPWGGYPGATLSEPRSGIGRVHDPLLLPLVHNAILRAPLVGWPLPAWFPWHRHGAALARGLVDMYGRILAGRSGLVPLLRMLPRVLNG